MIDRPRPPREPRDFPHFRRRLLALAALGAALLAVALMRLSNIMIVHGGEYREASDRHMWRPERIDAPRGLIVDRRGEVLASNRVVYDVLFSRIGLNRREERTAVAALAPLFPDTVAAWRERHDAGRRLPRRPMTIARGLPLARVAPLLERLEQLEGMEIEERFERHYPVQGAALGHILGYVQEVNPSSLRALLRRWDVDTSDVNWAAMGSLRPFANLLLRHGYVLGDAVGVQGLEMHHERALRGLRGRRENLQDAHSLVLLDAITEPARPGQTLHLTLDMRLQRRAAELMAEHRGALIAMIPRDGAIRAMVSMPSFDSDQPLTGRGWREVATGSGRALFSRAAREVYSPGSVVKPLLALGALRDGVIDLETRFYCDGTHQLGDHTFRCDYIWGCEWMDVRNALRRSCNIFFYNTASRLGQERWTRICRAFGLFEPTGIDLPHESRGHAPQRSIYPGELVQMGIGQGPFDATPLQMVTAYARLAADNASVEPHLVERRVDAHGVNVWESTPPERIGPVLEGVQPYQREVVIRGMLDVARAGVPYEERGTATPVGFPREWQVAGKTGTAQNRGLIDSWFIAFAPADDPEIVVGCVVEGGGHGSETAAPIVRELMGTFFAMQASDEIEAPVPPVVAQASVSDE